MADINDFAPPPPTTFNYNPGNQVISGPSGPVGKFNPKTNQIEDFSGGVIGTYNPSTGGISTPYGFTGTFNPSTNTITGGYASPAPVGGGGGFEFDWGALLEMLSGAGQLSPEERALISEQVASLRQQRDLLQNQIRLQDIFGEIQATEGGYQYIRAPSGFADRQALGAQYGLPTTEIPKTFKDRQKLGAQYGLPTLDAPADKAARQELATKLGIKVGDLPKAGQPIYNFEGVEKLYQLPAAGQLVTVQPGEGAKTRAEIESQLQQRSLQALRGELPISPTLERELGQRSDLVNESLRRQLGPGYETSTAGADVLAKERAFATETRESARRGELTLAEQLGLAQGSQRLAETGAIAGIPAGNFAIAAGLGSQAAGYSAPLGAYAGARQAGLQGALGAANVILGQQDLGLRSRALDIQQMLGLGGLVNQRSQIGMQGDAIAASRDAALWNAIANGVGLLGGAALTRWG